MKKNKFLYLIMIMGLLSCTSAEDKSLDSADTTSIVRTIFDNKLFVDENLRLRSDTLYILKSKYINDSWPKRTKHFNLKYIDSTSRATIVNFGPSSPYDGRRRLSVLRFNRSMDSLKVLILSHGDQVYFICKLLIDSNQNWKILETSVDDVGRRAKYEFEEEQWYKDWLKRTKAERRIKGSEASGIIK